MQAHAVVFKSPRQLELRGLDLRAPAAGELEVDIEFSGISTGTERLLWDGTMPAFPGMGYPLVPGYESDGLVTKAGAGTTFAVGSRVFVPGAQSFEGVKNLFGGSASRLVVLEERTVAVDDHLGAKAVLLALAATSQHALANKTPPDLIIGHGVMGRLLARLTLAAGHPAPTVWELNPRRQQGAEGYSVVRPDQDAR